VRESGVTRLESRHAVYEAFQLAADSRDGGAPALNRFLPSHCCVVILLVLILSRRGLALSQ